MIYSKSPLSFSNVSKTSLSPLSICPHIHQWAYLLDTCSVLDNLRYYEGKMTFVSCFIIYKAFPHLFSYRISTITPKVRRAKMINNPILQMRKVRTREVKWLLRRDKANHPNTDQIWKLRYFVLTRKLHVLIYAHAHSPPHQVPPHVVCLHSCS